MRLEQLIQDLTHHANPSRAKVMQGFFKLGKGQYGEGDVFLGVTVPEQRKIAKKYQDLPLPAIKKLLSSKVHEHRLTALLILIFQFKRAEGKERKKIFTFLATNRKYVNNWDLVDTVAPAIVGGYLCTERACTLLKKLVRSKNLWDRRIAIVSTLAMIRKGRLDITLALSKTLLSDTHDLIHKAVGWMLREAGKRDETALKTFLHEHAHTMPRTMLRYAIERLHAETRTYYMAKRKAM